MKEALIVINLLAAVLHVFTIASKEKKGEPVMANFSAFLFSLFTAGLIYLFIKEL